MSTAIRPMPRRFVRPTYEVYNPGDTGASLNAGGRSYHWLPQDVCEIFDHLQWPKDDDNRLVTTGRKEIATSAEDVAQLLCSDAHLGPVGFCILQGADDERLEQMGVARKIWVEQRSEAVAGIIEAWEQLVASESRPGKVPRRTPPRVKRAYEDRERFAEIEEQRKEFVCASCGMDFDVAADFASHTALHHPGAASLLPEAAPKEIEKPEEPGLKRQNSKSKKGLAILQAAEDAGLELSVADKKGLKFGDRDVVKDVEERLDNHDAVADDPDGGVDMSPEPVEPEKPPKGPKSVAAEAKAGALAEETAN